MEYELVNPFTDTVYAWDGEQWVNTGRPCIYLWKRDEQDWVKLVEENQSWFSRIADQLSRPFQ